MKLLKYIEWDCLNNSYKYNYVFWMWYLLIILVVNLFDNGIKI